MLLTPFSRRLLTRRVRAATLAAIVLSGCGSESSLSRLAPEAVIVAFGDSLTHGTGAQPEHSYPEVLERLIGRTVVNAGIPGEISAEGLLRLPSILVANTPALVIVCHGGNDILRRLDLSETESNIREMVGLIRAFDAQVVIVGVPKPAIFLTSAAYYERIATDLGVPFDGDSIGNILRDSRYKADAIHPNAVGYEMLAKSVAELLRDAGAI